jgi:uncharacterized membrane protein
MKAITSIVVGILLIIVGISVLAYQGFSYTKQEKIMQIGSVQVIANTEKTVYLPPVLGGLSLVAGVALVLIGRRYRK